MARKQLTHEEKIARAEKRLQNLREGNVVQKQDVQLSMADWMTQDIEGNLLVTRFPKPVTDIRYFVHVQHNGQKFRVYLKGSKRYSELNIPDSIRPKVEFPEGIAFKESKPCMYGTITAHSEQKYGEALVIAELTKIVDQREKANTELQASLAEFAARANKGKK